MRKTVFALWTALLLLVVLQACAETEITSPAQLNSPENFADVTQGTAEQQLSSDPSAAVGRSGNTHLFPS